MAGEDAHLEASYEDKVVDLSYGDGYDPDLNEEEYEECEECGELLDDCMCDEDQDEDEEESDVEL